MILPRLNTSKKKIKRYTYAFGGVNKEEAYSEGELSDSRNISFDAFPAISSGREKTEPSMMSFDKAYTYIDAGGGLVAYKYNGETKELTLGYLAEKKDAAIVGETKIADAEEKERFAARLGKYVVVFPDKLYLDLDDTESGFINMEKTFELPRLSSYLSNNSIELTRENYNAFKKALKTGDVVSVYIRWFVGEDHGGTVKWEKFIIRDLDEENYKIIFDPNAFKVQGSRHETDKITFKTEVPNLSRVTVFGGRVWGFDEEGKIHASKYYDPTVWEYFDLSSADSYTLETDTTGEFTALIQVADHVAFFKEDKIHRITGTKPSNFRHSVVLTNGVAKGGDKTLCLKDGVLYYIGADGVYAYGGAESERISDALGGLSFKNGAGVFYKDMYYISINDGEKSSLYGYDTVKKMWLSDSDEEFKNAFKFLGESLYVNSDNEVKKIADGKNLKDEMSLTFREFKEQEGEQKGWGRIYIMARLKKGESLKAEVDYGFGFEPQGVFTDYNKTVFELRLKPNRGDKISLRLTASPGVVITKIMREHHVHGSVF